MNTYVLKHYCQKILKEELFLATDITKKTPIFAEILKFFILWNFQQKNHTGPANLPYNQEVAKFILIFFYINELTSKIMSASDTGQVVIICSMTDVLELKNNCMVFTVI